MIATDTHLAGGANHSDTRSSRSLAKMNQVLNMRLGQSGSIRNLISFYEATYSKKQRSTVTDFAKVEAPKELMNKYERHISSPVMSSHSKTYSKASFLNLPSSVSPPASPGFLPSPSSSSSSSTEKLSLSSSGSYNSDSLKKDKASSVDKDSKGMKSASLLWSISTTSSSSGFSSGFSSPSTSEAPTPFTNEETLKKSITDTSINHNEINSKMSGQKIKSSKTTHSIQNLAEQFLGKKTLTSLKLRHTSMNKLFESKKTKQLKHKQINSEEAIKESTTATTDAELQTSLERPTDLTLFKSKIKKVLHTVKLRKLEKFTPNESLPETKEDTNPTTQTPALIVASDSRNNNRDSDKTKVDIIPLDSCLLTKTKEQLEPKQEPEPIKEKRSTKTETTVNNTTTLSSTTTNNKNNNHVQNIEAIKKQSVNPIIEEKIVKSNSTTKPFDKRALHVTNSFRTNTHTKLNPTPSWSSQLSTSYSFSTSNRQPVTRTQSQKYVKTNNNNRRYDPRNAQKIVLEWCQHHTRNYPNVNIVNFSSSWSDGLAFCALIHNFKPDSFDYEALTADNRRHNFELAFETAHSKASVMPLLEVEDMLSMGNRPDDRCVYTYVSTIFSRFQSRSTTNANKENKTSTTSTTTTTKTVNSTKYQTTNYQKSISLID